MRKIGLLMITFVALALTSALRAAAPATQPATQPSNRTAARVEKLKADLKTFQLRLHYTGEQDKPFYNLLLTVPNPPERFRDDPFDPQVQITAKEAEKIIDHLAGDGFFDRALDGNRNASPAAPNGPYYTLMVWVDHNGEQDLVEEWLPVDPSIFPHLDGLRKILDGEAAKSLDLLINRLSGFPEKAHKGAAEK